VTAGETAPAAGGPVGDTSVTVPPGWSAGAVLLVLLVSPVLFRLSFTFMTDVPFLALLLMSLYAYTKALRQHNVYWAAAGSLAAAATILIRQFGVVLPLAWGVCWLLDAERLKRIKFYGVGLILPAAATLWQVYMGTISPNWSARYTLQAQHSFLIQPIPALIGESIWRILITGLYLALFVAPLALPAILMYAQESRQQSLRRRTLLSLAASALIVIITIFVSAQRPNSSTLMPYIPWDFGLTNLIARLALTLVSIVAAIALWPLFIRHFQNFRTATLPERLIDASAFFSLLVVLGFYKIGDDYLFVLIPFALLAVGKAVQPYLVRVRGLVIAVCSVGVLILSLWMHWQLAYFEAEWHAADTVHQSGIAADQIATEWSWSSYYGAFDAYAASTNGKPLTAASEDEYFSVWLPYWLNPAYVVTRDLSKTPGEVVYQGNSDENVFQPQPIYVVKRVDASP
jgi:hypothetical protein